MAIAYVGGAHTTSDNSYGATVSVTYTPTAGNYVLIMLQQENNITQASCKDNNNNVIALLTNVPVRGNTYGMAVFLAKATAGATSFTIIWTTNGHPCAAIAEYSGAASIGASTTNTGSATTFSNAQSVTTAGNLILSAVGIFVAGNPTAAAISTGTKRQDSGAATAYNESILTENTNGSGNTVVGTQTGGSSLQWGIASVELVAIVPPTVTTQAVSSITTTSGLGNGNITATGGTNATSEGFVYDTVTHTLPGNVAPGSSGYASNVTQSGSYGTGAFTETIGSLSVGVTYYVRAWAYNGALGGYSYGGEVSFTTTSYTVTIGSAGSAWLATLQDWTGATFFPFGSTVDSVAQNSPAASVTSISTSWTTLSNETVNVAALAVYSTATISGVTETGGYIVGSTNLNYTQFTSEYESLADEHYVQATAGATTPGFSWTTAGYAAIVAAAFKVASGTPSLAQTATGVVVGWPATFTVSPSAVPSVGDLLVLSVYSDTAIVAPVTDSFGNTWILVNQTQNSVPPGFAQMYYTIYGASASSLRLLPILGCGT